MSAEQRLLDKHGALFCAVELTCLGDWRVVLRFNGRPDEEIARHRWRWMALRIALAVRVEETARNCPHCGLPVALPRPTPTTGAAK